MKTIAQLIGVPDDPAHEAAAKEFYSECGRIEQSNAQTTHLTAVDRRRDDWEASWKIVQAWHRSSGIGANLRLIMNNQDADKVSRYLARECLMEFEGITEQDIHDTRPPERPVER